MTTTDAPTNEELAERLRAAANEMYCDYGADIQEGGNPTAPAEAILMLEAAARLSESGGSGAFPVGIGMAAETHGAVSPSTTPEPSPAQCPASPPTLAALVERQANDPALWFVAQTAPEAYLQKALRELHRAIEESPADLSEEAREVAPIIAWALGRLFQLSRQSAITAEDGDDLRRIRALITRLSQRNAGLERALAALTERVEMCLRGVAEYVELLGLAQAARAALKGERT